MADLIDILNDAENFSRFSPQDTSFEEVDNLLDKARDSEDVLYDDKEDFWLLKGKADEAESEVERVKFKNLKSPPDLFHAAGKGRSFECPIPNNFFVGYKDSALIYDDNNFNIINNLNCRVSSNNKDSILRAKSIATSDQKVSFPDVEEIHTKQLNLGTIKLKKEGDSWHRKVKSSIITVRYHDGPQWSGLVVIISDIEGLHYSTYSNEFLNKRMKIKLNFDYTENAKGIPLTYDDTNTFRNQVKISDAENDACTFAFYSHVDFSEFTGSGKNANSDYPYLDDLITNRTNLVKARYGPDLMESF